MIHGPKAAVMTCHGPALSGDKPLTAEFGALYDHHQHRLIFPEDYLSKVVAINLDLIADKATIILIIPICMILHLWMPHLRAILSPTHSAFCDLPFLVASHLCISCYVS